jgi:hypothetical protein
LEGDASTPLLERGILTPLFRTLKALADFSPGFALKPWVIVVNKEIVRNPDERVAVLARRQPFQGCVDFLIVYFPKVPKRNPGLKFANAFSVS